MKFCEHYIMCLGAGKKGEDVCVCVCVYMERDSVWRVCILRVYLCMYV